MNCKLGQGFHGVIIFSIFSVQALHNSTNTQCSYWDQSLDEGYGGWSTEGCSLVEETREEAVCECNHLGNFAITLVRVSFRVL